MKQAAIGATSRQRHTLKEHIKRSQQVKRLIPIVVREQQCLMLALTIGLFIVVLIPALRILKNLTQPLKNLAGVVMDSALLQTLEPNSRVELLLKNGDQYLGRENISSVSPLTDNEIIINDTKYPATEIALPVAGMDEEISLIVLMK